MDSSDALDAPSLPRTLRLDSAIEDSAISALLFKSRASVVALLAEELVLLA